MNSQLSRREFLARTSQGLVLALLASCRPQENFAATPPPTNSATLFPSHTATLALKPRAPDGGTSTSPVTPIPTTPEGPSLDVKLGQMLMVGFRGLTLTRDNPILQDLHQRHLGSVVLFDFDVPGDSPVRNIQSPAQLASLTAALQNEVAIPLLIATDQEGGNVVRLKEKFGFPATVSEQQLGTRDDPAQTWQNAETMARALADAGINLNLAPVVDLNTNPDNPIIGKLERSFSADPTVVTRQALVEIEAHHQHGVLTTLKHFPGHGSSKNDSHQGFVDVTDTWTRADLEPYARIIAAGECDTVMTAHIFNAKLDASLPATLSKAVITGLLREELHYDGVVISDDMQMGAISNYYGVETAVELAITAGVDILALANNHPFFFEPDIAARVFGILKKLVQEGKISEARIDQSYQRIMRLKSRLS